MTGMGWHDEPFQFSISLRWEANHKRAYTYHTTPHRHECKALTTRNGCPVEARGTGWVAWVRHYPFAELEQIRRKKKRMRLLRRGVGHRSEGSRRGSRDPGPGISAAHMARWPPGWPHGEASGSGTAAAAGTGRTWDPPLDIRPSGACSRRPRADTINCCGTKMALCHVHHPCRQYKQVLLIERDAR